MPFARLPHLPIRAQEMRASALATLLAFALIGPSLAHATAEAANIEIGDTLTGNYLAALVANEDHDASAAAAYFREALRADPRNQDILARSFAAALESGAFADASVLADRVLAHDPGNSLARLTGAARAISDGQFSAARLQLGQGDAGRARDITTTLIDAWAYAGAGDLRRALAVADRITDPKVQSFKNFHAGLIAETLGDSAEAQRRLKSAYEADKGTLRLVDAYGRFLSRHNDAEGAKAVYRDFAKIAGRQALVEAAQAELSAGRVLERLVHNAREGAAEVLYGLGAGGGSEGDEIAEIIYLRLALQLRPDHALAAVTLGDLLNQIKQGDAAIKAFGALPTDSPLRESADIQAALTLDTLSRPADALKRMREIVEAHPRDIEALTAYASLQRAGLWDEVKGRLSQSGTSLSGGQQQRLCIARTIAVDPEVILMDEPTSALDPIASAKVEDLIDELRANYAIVIVTHNMQQAARVSQSTAYFHLGDLVESGSTDMIFTNPRQKLTEDYITGRIG